MCGARFEEELNPMRRVNLILAVRWPLMGIADARHIVKCSHRRTFVESRADNRNIWGKRREGEVVEDGEGEVFKVTNPG